MNRTERTRTAAKKKSLLHWMKLISSMANHLSEIFGYQVELPEVRNRVQAMKVFNQLKHDVEAIEGVT